MAAEPTPGVEYPLHCASLLGKRKGRPPADEFLTLRYDFKPASAGRAGEGHLDVQAASQKVSLQMGEAAFTGKYEPARGDHASLDCVAVFDGTSFRLELLGATVKSLRHVSGAGRLGGGGSNPRAGAAPAPAAAVAAAAAAGTPAAAAAEAAAAVGGEGAQLECGFSALLEEELFRELAGSGEAAAVAAAPAGPEDGSSSGEEEEVEEEAADESESEEEAAAAEAPPAPLAAAAAHQQRAAAPLPPLAAAHTLGDGEDMNEFERLFFGLDADAGGAAAASPDPPPPQELI